jgi:hypothetical protein
MKGRRRTDRQFQRSRRPRLAPGVDSVTAELESTSLWWHHQNVGAVDPPNEEQPKPEERNELTRTLSSSPTPVVPARHAPPTPQAAQSIPPLPATPVIPPVYGVPARPAAPIGPPLSQMQGHPGAPVAPPVSPMPAPPSSPGPSGMAPHAPALPAQPAAQLALPFTPAPHPPQPGLNLPLYAVLTALFLIAVSLLIFFGLKS